MFMLAVSNLSIYLEVLISLQRTGYTGRSSPMSTVNRAPAHFADVKKVILLSDNPQSSMFGHSMLPNPKTPEGFLRIHPSTPKHHNFGDPNRPN